MSTRNFRRRTSRRRRRGQAPGEAPPERGQNETPARSGPAARTATAPLHSCPLCGKPVRELPMALAHRATGLPAHFDCIMRELRDVHQIGPQEKICYLGSGCFGIIEFKQPVGSGKFIIKQKIQYEEKESPTEWKKGLLASP